MPIHDWTRVDAGIFHAFHHEWVAVIARVLNRGVLPPSYYALPEQIAGGLGPDVLALHLKNGNGGGQGAPAPEGGLALAVAPPKVRLRVRPESTQYAAKAKAVVVRHVSNHQVVARVEIVSPGNKNNQNGFNAFVRKAREALAAGVHLLLMDLFPPSRRDPQGIHLAIWGEEDGEGAPPPDKPLMCVAYLSGAGPEAFINFIAVGDELPNMPLCLTQHTYVEVPLEATYRSAWDAMPDYWRDVLTTPEPPSGP